MRVGDLVEIPEIRTVIQLKDLERSDLRRMIGDSFVVTEEVSRSLRMLLSSLASPEGRGVFVKGHFGSGKSHFLSILSLLLRYPSTWEPLIVQESSLAGLQTVLQGKKFLTVEISLIQHRGTEFLEDIFLKEIFREITSVLGRPFEGQESRRETFAGIRTAMKDRGFSGLVLLVDELSEFLRSKTDAHAYQEDIRFLQYVGEEASSFPLWIVASLQEWIEETGEISQDTFNKIKDRYPLRLNLGRAHIEELVSHRLIRQKPGAREEIRAIFQNLRGYFPSFPVDADRFTRLYPVHPATITLLDRLKPLFSEHRGIVDFIHYRLRGDGERGIPSFLDRPAEDLLGPAAIFDHFLDRIRETAETQPFVEKCFDHYRDEIPRIFNDPDQQTVALEVVKILILLAISPVQARFTARHLAEMVLFRVTKIDAGINYQYLRDVLDLLAKESSFLAVTPGKDRLDDQFSIDLRVDVSAVLRRKIRQGAAEIFPGDRRIHERLFPFAESPYVPFAGWAEQRQQKISYLWEYTRRTGMLLLRPIDEIPAGELEEMAAAWRQSEDDFYIIVGTPSGTERQYAYLRQTLLPLAKEKWPGMFLFWVPGAITGEEEETLKELLAALFLRDKMREDTAANQPGVEYLNRLLQAGSKRLGEIFAGAYFRGSVLWDDRQVELTTYGSLVQEKFFQEFLPPLLARRFPRHNRVHPYLEAFASTLTPSLVSDFFVPGSVDIDERSKFALRAVLEGVLKPMGFLRKRGNRYFLHVDPGTNELAAGLFSLLGKGAQPLESLYWSLRKGEYGLFRNQFEVLVLALIFSGHIVAYQGQRKRALEEISRSGLQGVTGVGKGEILSEELRSLIPRHPLIPEKFRKASLSLPSQETLWGEVKGLKESEVESLRNLLNRIGWASSFQAFKNLPWDSLRRDAEDILGQWEEVKTSFPPREGLERFLAAASREPFLAEKLRRMAELRDFFNHAERILFIHQYVSEPRLVIPDDPEFLRLREQRQDLLRFFEKDNISIAAERMQALVREFQEFRDRYVRTYTESHRRAKSGEQFAPYSRVRASRRYQLLAKLDQLEMISVPHNRSSVDRVLTSVLQAECGGPAPEGLQNQPVCACGFILGQKVDFPPLRQIEVSVDQGIRETLEALAAPPYQEKLIAYLNGLDEVGEQEKAAAIRALLNLNPEENDFLDKAEGALTPQALEGINEAFRGRVVVVKRDLDQLYDALVQRKYTLPQVRKIFREWLRESELSESTFLHFMGRAEGGGETAAAQDLFSEFLEGEFPHLLPLAAETGRRPFYAALLFALWGETQEIAPREILPFFPILKRGREQGDLFLRELARAAGFLQEKNPALFETVVQIVEGDEDHLSRAWKLLEGRRPQEVFRRESIFPSILRDAFEKILASPETEDEGVPALDDSPAPPRTAGFIRRRTEMAEAREEYEILRQKLQILKRKEAKPPQEFSKWESLYVGQLSPVSFIAGTLPHKLKRLEIPPPIPAREILAEAEAVGRSLCQAFETYLRGLLPQWETGGEKRPLRVEDLPGFNPWRRKVSETREPVFILMDGMRWDLWEYVKEEFIKPMAHQVRIVQEGCLWAHLPSSTPAQTERLEGAFEKASPGRNWKERLWKIGGVDERVHTEKGSLEYLFRNVVQCLQLDLAPRLRELPPRTGILFFSDHGFVENPRFEKGDKYRSSRYIHGETSPFEVIVPWAAAVRI